MKLPFDTCAVWHRQLIEVEGEMYEIERSFSWKDFDAEGWQFSGNRVLVCPRCLRQWAHLDFRRPMAQGEPEGCLIPVGQFCGRCGPGWDGEVSGSVLGGKYQLDLPLLYALPEALLLREFGLHLQFYYEGESHGRSED